MNTVNCKYNPGDHVFGVHFYPSGAKIFEGDVVELLIRVTKIGTYVRYKLTSWSIGFFAEDCIFISKEEAEKAKLDWKQQIKDKQYEEDSSIPSMLPYPNSGSRTETYRVSVLRRWNS